MLDLKASTQVLQPTRNWHIELLEYLYSVYPSWRVQIYLFCLSAFRLPASFWAFTKSTRQLSELSQMILWTKFWLWKPGLSQSQPSSVTPKDQAKSPSAITRLKVTPQRSLHFATACVNFCKWLDHHVWNNWSPGSCSEFWGSLLHAQSLQKR